MKRVVLPDSGDRSLAFYLAMEEYVARSMEGEYLFVWRVNPTVIIGRNQDLESEVNTDYCRRHDVRVVRRRSGGGCVYSDKGNVMISYVSGRGDVDAVFDRFLSGMSDCLRSMGLDAVRSERNDLMVGDRKVSGNALQMLPDRSIVHGTLLYSTDMDALESAIRPPVEKLARHAVRSVRNRVMNLDEVLAPLGIASVGALEDYLLTYLTESEVMLSVEDVSEIENIARGYEVII